MSSVKKLISMLDLVTEQRMSWTPEEISRALNMSLPTVYRYVRELFAAGLFARLPGGRYTLGPRILTLDYQMRRADPLHRVGGALLESFSRETGLSVLVSYFLNDQVLNVYQAGPSEQISHGRGQITPLFRSSTARVILAFQKQERQKRLFEKFALDPDRALIGEDWPTFRKALNDIRREGSCRTTGLLVPDRVGVAAPLLDAGGVARGSVTVIGAVARLNLFNETALRSRLMEVANELANGLDRESWSVVTVGTPKSRRGARLKI